jgi:hypothetical protein
MLFRISCAHGPKYQPYKLSQNSNDLFVKSYEIDQILQISDQIIALSLKIFNILEYSFKMLIIKSHISQAELLLFSVNKIMRKFHHLLNIEEQLLIMSSVFFKILKKFKKIKQTNNHQLLSIVNQQIYHTMCLLNVPKEQNINDYFITNKQKFSQLKELELQISEYKTKESLSNISTQSEIGPID